MTPTLKLYELADRHRQIFEAIADADGELTPELEAALDADTADLPAKFESCCRRLTQLEIAAAKEAGEIAGVQAELDRLNARKAHLDRQQAELRGYMHRCLVQAKETRIDTEWHSVRLQNNPPSAKWIGDVNKIPAHLRREKHIVEFDAKSALAIAKADGDLPDDVLIQRTQKLVIK